MHLCVDFRMLAYKQLSQSVNLYLRAHLKWCTSRIHQGAYLRVAEVLNEIWDQLSILHLQII